MAVVSILLSSTIALTAYFYKEWKLKVESYIQQLCQMVWIIRNNECILKLMLSREVNARKARVKLELLPVFGLACLPLFDSHFRHAISQLNSNIIFIKEGVTVSQSHIETALSNSEIYGKSVEKILEFVVCILYDNALWYYIFGWLLRRRAKKYWTS